MHTIKVWGLIMEKKSEKIITIALTAAITFLITSIASVLIFFVISFSSGGKANLVQNMLEEYCLFDVDEEKMMDYAAMGIAASVGDPYTAYYPADEFQSYTEQISSSYVGVGITIAADVEKNEIKIISVTEDGPAEKAGLKAGDIMLAVDGKTYDASRMTEATMYIKAGDVGSSVSLRVRRGDEVLNIEVTREKIDKKSVSSKMLTGEIGYLKITSFDGKIEAGEEDTFDEFCNNLDGLKAAGAKKLIIDLRDNPGGDFNVVCDIVDKLVPEGIITYTEDKNGDRETVYSDDEELNMPIVVLVNGNSASASEILTGALKDYKKATVIGTQTYGKGIVQRVFTFPDGSGMSITVSKYFTPNGVCIHGVGIAPDMVVELESEKSLSELEESEDNQLQAAIEFLS